MMHNPTAADLVAERDQARLTALLATEHGLQPIADHFWRLHATLADKVKALDGNRQAIGNRLLSQQQP